MKKHKYKVCQNCEGILLPKKNIKNNELLLVCENRREYDCEDVFLDNHSKIAYKKLLDWNLNDFDIHDLMVISKDETKLTNAVYLVDEMKIPVYKKKVEALKDLLHSYIPMGIYKFYVCFKYKRSEIYKSLKYGVSFLMLALIIGRIPMPNINIIQPSSSGENVTEQKDESLPGIEANSANGLLDLINNENNAKFLDQIFKMIKGSTAESGAEDLKIIDSDQDGLTDYAEIIEYKTDPLKKDTDGDGFHDKEEIDGGFDPLTPYVK